MQDSDAPTKIVLPWASGAAPPYVLPGTVPVPSQIAVKNGAASYTDGFPPLSFVPIATGGAGPFGADTNSALNQFTGGLRWLQAGGPTFYDSAFQTAVGGYPAGALVQSVAFPGLIWYNLVDNNLTNPDTGGSGWVRYSFIRVAGNISIYVNSATGNDSNNGRTPTTAFQTLQAARNSVQANYSFYGGFNVTYRCTGTFTQSVRAVGPLVGQSDANTEAYIFAPGSGMIVANDCCMFSLSGAAFTVNGGTFQASGTAPSQGIGFYASQLGQIAIGTVSPPSFAACDTASMVSQAASVIAINGAFSVTGGGKACLYAVQNGVFYVQPGAVGTVSGTPNFSVAFALAQDLGTILVQTTLGAGFTGAATGLRYSSLAGSIIETQGAGPNVFPGSVAGTVNLVGGVYGNGSGQYV